MNARLDFIETFQTLTGQEPFDWQTRLYDDYFAADTGSPALPANIPSECRIPTGLGKTSVLAVWLIALANGYNVPRRLVYVVNRRTVVDQTTAVAMDLRKKLKEIPALRDRLQTLYKGSDEELPLAISTLRGQFADNEEWSLNPARPAIICGTVDMIGSRLLFSGYRIGYRKRPLHAGFLGQDTLLVHDEAHLEPAFQTLIESICEEQEKERARSGDLPWQPLRIMAMSATTRVGTDKLNNEKQGRKKPFELSDEEKRPPDELPDPPTKPIHDLWRRLKAKKSLSFPQAGDGKNAVAETIADLAVKQHNESNAAVLIFVRTPDDVKEVCSRLTSKKNGVQKDHIQQLAGTMRGLERDRMADPRRSDASRVFARFLTPPKPDAPESDQWKTKPMPGTVYLVCTSAGEVGVNLSADHMVCDLSTLDSMIQRFGRVNRFGESVDTKITVVYPTEKLFDEKSKVDKARKATLAELKNLHGDASPKNVSDRMSRLSPEEIEQAFSPPPTIVPTTDILFDAWALTSIRGKMPGRPPVEPFLHGIADWEPPQTTIAWREEVNVIVGTLLDRYKPEDLLEDFPLKPHELLREPSTRALKHLQTLAQRHPDAPVWVLDEQGGVEPLKLSDLTDKKHASSIQNKTVLLPPDVGGLSDGMLDGASEHADDISWRWRDKEGQWHPWADEHNRPQRARLRSDKDEPDNPDIARIRLVRSIVLESNEDDDTEPTMWNWYARSVEGGRTARKPVLLQTHVDDVIDCTERIVQGLSLSPELAEAVNLSAVLHDQGKDRDRFQIMLGNRKYPDELLAKSGGKGAQLHESFRHEFASLLDAREDERFKAVGDEMQALVLHLIAAHHGRARPHFSQDEAFDPTGEPSEAVAMAIETPRRFAHLQRRYGRWALAYLESLLRAADWAASANPSKVLDTNGTEVTL